MNSTGRQIRKQIILLKKIYRWQASTWEVVHYYSPLVKFELKPQWDVIKHLTEAGKTLTTKRYILYYSTYHHLEMGRCGEAGSLMHFSGDVKWQFHKMICQFKKKSHKQQQQQKTLHIQLLDNQEIPLLGIFPKKLKLRFPQKSAHKYLQ